ncbi:MAG: hypothetical protein H0W40_13200 [Methylibium sp.]|uniref:hypothetical protein n=1 Tax=Methylibium sp. TaxID=2067992 RepID=UPI00182AC123|nr:hypothetical protein [Methylibium sp.]MBA3598312.1 hypothetical protein [Methylibium sp.]
MTIQSQSDKAEAWLARHGVVGTSTSLGSSDLRPPLLRREETADEDDWATEAQRWYLQRAQGVDVAQLLPYHQTGK